MYFFLVVLLKCLEVREIPLSTFMSIIVNVERIHRSINIIDSNTINNRNSIVFSCAFKSYKKDRIVFIHFFSLILIKIFLKYFSNYKVNIKLL